MDLRSSGSDDPMKRFLVKGVRKMTRNAIIYSRYSPRPNAQDCQSAAKQIAKCKEYCQLKDYEIIGVFQDDGISGAKMTNRPELQKALSLACKNKAIIVVFSLSRLARCVKDAIIISEQLSGCGADLISLSEMIDTSSAMGRAFFAMSAVFGELERAVTAERTSTAMKLYQKNGKKMSRSCPYGMMDDPDKPGYMIENPLELAIIARIQCLRSERLNYSQISRLLGKEGHKQRNGKAFHHYFLSKLLKA